MFDQGWIIATLKDEFPNHPKSDEGLRLLDGLVRAYVHWWWLMLTYPERRIVGTPPLWYVRKIHSRRLEVFFSDCFSYLGRLVTKEDLWRGDKDFRGALDTARSLEELIKSPEVVWSPIMRCAKAQKQGNLVRIT